MCTVSDNKVVLDFCQLNSRPPPSAVKQLVTELGVKPENLRAVVCCRNRNAIILELASGAVAANIVTKQLKYQGVNVPLYFDDSSFLISVHDIPSDVANESIAKAMSQYGEVLTIVNDRWRNFFPGVLTGARTLRVRELQARPKYLTVGNIVGTVIYKGQKSARKLADKKKSNKKTNSSEEEQQPPNNNNHIINNDNNNKNKNSNNNYSINNNEKEKQISDPAQDDEGFEVVRSKHDRKILKRQHSEGKATPAKLPGHLRADFFGRRWIEAYRKSEEAVDVVSKQQAERLKTMFKEKFEECYFKLPKEEQEQVTVFEDIIDLELYND